MAQIDFALVCPLICFLAGVSSAEDSEEKDVDGGKLFDHKTLGGEKLGAKSRWDSFKGQLPASLAASVSFGPYIPLGIPVPQPSFPSPVGGDLDGAPVPDPSFPYEDVGHLDGVPVPYSSYPYEDVGHPDGVPGLESLLPFGSGVGPEGVIIGPGNDAQKDKKETNESE